MPYITTGLTKRPWTKRPPPTTTANYMEPLHPSNDTGAAAVPIASASVAADVLPDSPKTPPPRKLRVLSDVKPSLMEAGVPPKQYNPPATPKRSSVPTKWNRTDWAKMQARYKSLSNPGGAAAALPH